MSTLPARPSPTLADIERLYAGEVGDAYTRRHQSLSQQRYPFWQAIASQTEATSVLEVGCNSGHNLACLTAALAPQAPTLVGVDVNALALSELQHVTWGRATGVRASAGALPFATGAFDLVVSACLLIHVPADALPGVLAELGRVAKRHVLLVEYEDTHRREIPWRGQRHVLWAAPFGFCFWQVHPLWHLVDRGDAGRGFDRCGYSLFRRNEAN